LGLPKAISSKLGAKPPHARRRGDDQTALDNRNRQIVRTVDAIETARDLYPEARDPQSPLSRLALSFARQSAAHRVLSGFASMALWDIQAAATCLGLKPDAAKLAAYGGWEGVLL
jgi:hypothetical protein